MNDIHGMPVMHHRRDILRSCLSCGGLLALGGLATMLGWRNLHGTCLRSHPCGGCPVLADCGQPKALEVKRQSIPDARHGAAKPNSRHGRNPV